MFAKIGAFIIGILLKKPLKALWGAISGVFGIIYAVVVFIDQVVEALYNTICPILHTPKRPDGIERDDYIVSRIHLFVDKIESVLCGIKGFFLKL